MVHRMGDWLTGTTRGEMTREHGMAIEKGEMLLGLLWDAMTKVHAWENATVMLSEVTWSATTTGAL